MMVNTILLASNNAHKHQEFIRLFPGIGILTPRDVGMGFDFDEDGDSFLANAHGKAMALFRAARRPVIADDSGLCVAALDGEPGIRSARYGSGSDGVTLDAPRRNAYLLDRMNGKTERGAFFVCCLVLVLEEARYFIAQETVHGIIAEGPRGERGFGYDPLFLLPDRGKTIAELPDAEKDLVSHRGRAARRIRAILGTDAMGKEPSWT
jgi:XTP/dITP diphosphohydrolase